MLSKTKIHLKSEDGDDDLVFSPISDFGFFNKDKRADPQGSRATIYIKFNSLISKSILAKKWRQINYESVIEERNYLSRRLRKMLGLKFTYASPNRSFNINLSTLIENSGISLYERMSDNLKYAENALERYDRHHRPLYIEKKFAVHPVTKKGRVLADAKIILWPTKSFVQMQIENNIHHSKLDDARLDKQGQVQIEPVRGDFDSYKSYEAARSSYEQGRNLPDC